MRNFNSSFECNALTRYAVGSTGASKGKCLPLLSPTLIWKSTQVGDMIDSVELVAV